MKVALLFSLLFWCGIGFLLKVITGVFRFTDLLLVALALMLIAYLIFLADLHYSKQIESKKINNKSKFLYK